MGGGEVGVRRGSAGQRGERRGGGGAWRMQGGGCSEGSGGNVRGAAFSLV